MHVLLNTNYLEVDVHFTCRTSPPLYWDFPMHMHITLLTGFLNPRKEPKKVRGRETPNQRQRRASKVVKGMAPEDPAPQSMRFRTKNTTNTTLVKAREGEGWIIITLCIGHNGSPDVPRYKE